MGRVRGSEKRLDLGLALGIYLLKRDGISWSRAI